MDSEERTFSASEIREQRRLLAQRLALQQRQLDALAKMDEAAAELEQVEHEMEALARGSAEPEQPAEAVHPDPEPYAIGERAAKILRDHAGAWLIPREIMAEMQKRGWVDTDTDHAIQRIRHTLRRLAHNHPNIERDESDATYRYRWRSDVEGYALIPVPHTNGTAYPALHRGAG